MCSKVSVIQHKFCRYRYYQYGYNGSDTDTVDSSPATNLQSDSLGYHSGTVASV